MKFGFLVHLFVENVSILMFSNISKFTIDKHLNLKWLCMNLFLNYFKFFLQNACYCFVYTILLEGLKIPIWLLFLIYRMMHYF